MHRKKKCDNCNMTDLLLYVFQNKVLRNKEEEIKDVVAYKIYDVSIKIFRNEKNLKKNRVNAKIFG